MNADPVASANRTAAIRERYKDPEYRKSQARALHARHLKARQDPEKRARLDRNIWRARERLAEPEIAARHRAAVLAGQAKRHETIYAWCPKDRRAEYRRLVDGKNLLAAEARAVIEASMSPFEKQLARVRNGASLIHIRPYRWEPEMSYTGCSLGDLG